ncbi:MAG: FHA domain-containing protein [Planctomycetota bacterium]
MMEVHVVGPRGDLLNRAVLDPGRLLRIGRSPECHIRITAPSVSRNHALVARMPGSEDVEWVLRDLESRHGTRVLGKRVREVTVYDGLEAQVGPARLRFVSLTEKLIEELTDSGAADEADDDAPPMVFGNFAGSPSLSDSFSGSSVFGRQSVPPQPKR